MMAFALFESLAVIGFLLLLSVVLPSSWLRDGFALKGFVSIAVFTTTSILLQKHLDNYPSVPVLMLIILLPIAVIVGILFLIRSKPKVQRLLLNVQDRASIMLFLYVPLGLFSLLVILYRNLL